MAALHGAQRDDLRRPRDHRRLELLGVLAGARCARSPGGRSGSPAGSPRTGSTSTWATCPRTSSPPTRCTPRSSPPRTPPQCCASSAQRVDAEADAAHDPERWRATSTSGATPSTSVGPGWSCWTTGAAGCSSRDTGRCCPPASGTGSPTRRAATTTTSWSAPRCPGCCRRRSITWRRGTSGWPVLPAAGGRPRRARCAVGCDLEHWAAFRRSFERLATLFADLGLAP